jgi:hypothetical protein
MRTVTRRPARISAARIGWPSRLTVPPVDTTRSTSTAAPGLSGAGSGGGPAGRPPVTARRAMSALDR